MWSFELTCSFFYTSLVKSKATGNDFAVVDRSAVSPKGSAPSRRRPTTGEATLSVYLGLIVSSNRYLRASVVKGKVSSLGV